MKAALAPLLSGGTKIGYAASNWPEWMVVVISTVNYVPCGGYPYPTRLNHCKIMYLIHIKSDCDYFFLYNFNESR